MPDTGRPGESRVPKYPPFALPSQPAGPVLAGGADPPPDDDYPPIEQFLDELPSIDDYAEPAEPAPSDPGLYAVSDSIEQDQDAEGWAISRWQSYDWHGLASLGMPAPERAEADAEWGATDWPEQEGSESSAGPSLEEIASALDAIAYRIRSGELSLDQFRGTPPEAAIAAVLGSLLKMRR